MQAGRWNWMPCSARSSPGRADRVATPTTRMLFGLSRVRARSLGLYPPARTGRGITISVTRRALPE